MIPASPRARARYAHVVEACAERLEEELEAPDEEPEVGPYLAAWALCVVTTLGVCYYMIAFGSSYGRKKTAVWLEGVSYTLVIYFMFINPIVIFVLFVIVPSLAHAVAEHTIRPEAAPHYPHRSRAEILLVGPGFAMSSRGYREYPDATEIISKAAFVSSSAVAPAGTERRCRGPRRSLSASGIPTSRTRKRAGSSNRWGWASRRPRPCRARRTTS